MSLQRFLSVLAMVSSCAVGWQSSAGAADAYVCGPDKIVYVEVSELEEKKRSDPCIAAYYGLSIGSHAKPSVDQVVTAPTKTPASADTSAAAPIKRPQPPQFKSLSEAPAIERQGRNRQASLQFAPESAPATDFRNVRILNAASDDAAWYRHVR